MAVLIGATGSGSIRYPYNGAPGPGWGGGGSLWSSGGGIMWIGWNNAPAYPIYLNPGWNEVYYYIPLIFPDDEWIEAHIIITAPGYLLIPAGFELNLGIAPDAPVQTGNPKMTDKLKFIDVYDIEIETVQPPFNMDEIIEDMVFEDEHGIDIIKATILAEQTVIEDMVFEDEHGIDIIKATMLAEQAVIEDMVFEDEHELELVATRTINESNNESIDFMDINEQDVIGVELKAESTAEDLGIEDIYNIELE